MVGPAVTGRLASTPRGSRLDVRVRRYAPAPAQRSKLGAVALGTVAVLVAMMAAVGIHPVLLGLAGVTILGVLTSVIFYGHRRRSQDIRDLMAIVERTFGPLELPSAEDAPYRQYDPDDREP